MKFWRRLATLVVFGLLVAGCKHSDVAASGQNGGGDSGKLVKTDVDHPALPKGNPEDFTAETGDTAIVLYDGTLENGTDFDGNFPSDPSNPAKPPFAFVIGQGSVIKGWDQGVVGMTVGQTRDLTIPPDLGYGASGKPPTIPPSSTLKFKIKLLGLVKSDQGNVYDYKDVKLGSGPAAKKGDIVTITVKGSLLNGKSFQTTDGPLTYQLGSGKVPGQKQSLTVVGLRVAVEGMKVGGERIITLPPLIGFAGNGPSPDTANQVLVFDVKLSSIKPGGS